MMTAEGDPTWRLTCRQNIPWLSAGVRAGRLFLDPEHPDSVS
jgi:hypothetical protein